MNVVVVIPARYGSSRLPGKPLAMVAGRMLIERVWSIARAVKGATAVYVATDDQRIADAAQHFGATVIMTSEGCRNGTERVYEAVAGLAPAPDIVINFQGDTPLTPPWIIEPLIDAMVQDPSVMIATPMVRLSRAQYAAAAESKKQTPFSGTYVTFDSNYRALYFSKSLIPSVRSGIENPPVYRHIGIYAYRYPLLAKYLALEPREFEIAEGLEQLRALEHGIPIRMVEVDYRGRTTWAVDSPEDVQEVEKILSREGEIPL